MPRSLTFLIGGLAASGLVLVGAVLVISLRLPPTTSYGLPDDVPAYPAGTLQDGLSERLFAAWGWNMVHVHSQPYSLPSDADPAQLEWWYEEEMQARGWGPVMRPPITTPGMATVSWWKGVGPNRRMAQIIVSRDSAFGGGYRLLIQASREGTG